MLWQSDEADLILGALGRYGGGDRARALDAGRLRRLTDGDRTEVHRARGNVRQIRTVASPFLSIEADLQPDRLDAVFESDDQRSGLTARFLIHEPLSLAGTRRYVSPPPSPEPWVIPELRHILERLWRIPLVLADDGSPHWQLLSLDEPATCLWATELETVEPMIPSAEAEERGFLGHLRGRLLRLAGVLGLLRWACDRNSLDCLDCLTSLPELRVTDEDMRMAIVWGRYFTAHHRRLFGSADSKRTERDEEVTQRFSEKVNRHLQLHPDRGVTPADLATFGGRRFRGTEGRAAAIALLNSMGWTPKRVTPLGAGRPTVAWFPPGAHHAAPPDSGQGIQTIQGIGHPHPSAGPGEPGVPADDLLRRASLRLLHDGSVTYPAGTDRGPCPVCGSPDGLASLPDSDRWYCHSTRHEGQRKTGLAVDLHFAMSHGRMPTPAEAVALSRQILGEGGTP